MKKILFLLPLVLVLLSCDLFEKALGGTIEGTVSNDTLTVSNGFVILLNNISDINQISELTSSGLSALTNVVKGFGVIDSDGTYKILAVPAGDFYLFAAIDSNEYNTLDSLDLIGWYGKDTSASITIPDSTYILNYTIPDTISIAEKEKRTNVNIDILVKKKEFETVYNPGK